MELYQIILAGLAALILFMIVFLWIVSLWIRKSRFGRRSDGNPCLKYFSADDFENLKADPVSFPSDKGQILRGFIYSDSSFLSPKGLVIWAHGFGAGHNAYTTEICYLARQGYLILAYDNTGCVLSDGKEVGSLVQGAIDASFAVNFACNDERLKAYKRVLVGHSWGGYSAMNIFFFNGRVDGVAAMCGFNNANQIIGDISRRYFGGFGCIIRFFTFLINRFRFGKYAALSADKSLLKSDVPVLLLYGKEDGVVPYRTNGQKILKATAQKENIRSVVYPNKGHSVYLTEKAEAYTKRVFGNISRLKGRDERERKEFYASIDYGLMTQEDLSVMNELKVFIDKIFTA